VEKQRNNKNLLSGVHWEQGRI